MERFKKHNFTSLLEMLSKYTRRYTRLLTRGKRNEEFYESMRALSQIQNEIHMRQAHHYPGNHSSPRGPAGHS